MSSTPPRNPNSNNPPPLVRSRISGFTADDETPPINLTPLQFSFPNVGMNTNSNSSSNSHQPFFSNQSLLGNQASNSNLSLSEFEMQLKSPLLSDSDKLELITESYFPDEVKQRLIKTHIFDPNVLNKIFSNRSGGTKKRIKSKKRKFKRKKTKRSSKRRKYKK